MTPRSDPHTDQIREALRRWDDWRGSGWPVGDRMGRVAVSELRGAIEHGDALRSAAEGMAALEGDLANALHELNFPETPKPGDGRAMRGSAFEWKQAAIGWRRRAVAAEAWVTQLEGERVLLDAVAEAALRATTDAPNQLAGSVEHPQNCGIWVEMDDVTGNVLPVGTCDCGLASLDLALDALKAARLGVVADGGGGRDPGCKRHAGDPHVLCPACWAAEVPDVE